MERYIGYISQLAGSGTDQTFANTDEKHALEVLVAIFRNSRKTVRIFAGSLCSSVPNDPRYVAALSDFIEGGGSVRIMLNRYNEEEAVKSNLFKRLAYYSSLGKDVRLYRTSAVPYLSSDSEKKEIHFTVGDDNSYRLETDITTKTATCNFNNPRTAGNLVRFFDGGEKAAQQIDLAGLFDN